MAVRYYSKYEGRNLTIQEKIKIACMITGTSITELAAKIGTSQSAFSQRLRTGKFSDDELNAIAEALGATYYSGFRFPDGSRIE